MSRETLYSTVVCALGRVAGARITSGDGVGVGDGVAVTIGAGVGVTAGVAVAIGVGVGVAEVPPGVTSPHHVPHMLFWPAYSWMVHIVVSSIGSTTVELKSPHRLSPVPKSLK